MGRWFGRRRRTVDEAGPPQQEAEAPTPPQPELERVPQKAQEREEASPEEAHEDEWIGQNADLITALREAGHEPVFSTELVALGAGMGQGWDTSMRCERCGERYRGPFLDSWRGLSPKRPCPG